METGSKVKIPQFVIECSVWRKVAGRHLSIVLDNSIQTKTENGSTIKILCIDFELFRIIQKYFIKNNIEYQRSLFQKNACLKSLSEAFFWIFPNIKYLKN